jgi:hypothetical protein
MESEHLLTIVELGVAFPREWGGIANDAVDADANLDRM